MKPGSKSMILIPILVDGDTHDLRDRWFPTEDEAKEHLEYTLDRWHHPAIWECFVRIA